MEQVFCQVVCRVRPTRASPAVKVGGMYVATPIVGNRIYMLCGYWALYALLNDTIGKQVQEWISVRELEGCFAIHPIYYTLGSDRAKVVIEHETDTDSLGARLTHAAQTEFETFLQEAL